VHVFCNAGGPNRGWWVVGLPSAGGKGNAMKYVMDKLGVEPEKALCCGDSGNDSPMFDFENVGVRGVVVANAFDDLRGYCEEQVCPEKRQPIHYFASERMAVSLGFRV
jgi:hydroxymethylpyrimidine pyrophosphatase-like HAD family hydrolase